MYKGIRLQMVELWQLNSTRYTRKNCC